MLKAKIKHFFMNMVHYQKISKCFITILFIK